MERTFFEAVVAHELGHVRSKYPQLNFFLYFSKVYLQLNDIQLPSDITEGVCELFAYLYIQNQWSKKPTRKLYIAGDKIRKNKDPVYGGGFRKVFEMWNNYDRKNQGLDSFGDFLVYLKHKHPKYKKDKM